MTKRDYTAVAKVLAANLTTTNDMDTVATVTRDLAFVFKHQNPNFRYDYFFDAVGLDSFGFVK